MRHVAHRCVLGAPLFAAQLLCGAAVLGAAIRLGQKKTSQQTGVARTDPMVIVSPELFPWHRNVQPFRALDDLNPDAPMDVVATDAIADKRGFSLYPKMLGWNSAPSQQATVIPAYSRPETFPSEAALQNADRKGKLNYHWFHRVAEEVTQDSAEKSPHGGHTVTKYRVEPADTSFPNGNVFSPQGTPAGTNLASGGFAGDAVLAPEDKPKLGQELVPLLARLDGWTPVASGSGRIGIPVVAKKDTVPFRYARYVDQVADNAASCARGSRRPHCVVAECEKNEELKDKFTLLLGNSVVPGSVSIVKRLKEDGFRVKYSLKDFFGNAGAIQAGAGDGAENEEKYKATDCSELGCTLYRPCHHEAGAGPWKEAGCAAMETQDALDAFKDLLTTRKCPRYHSPCETIMQDVNAGSVFTEGGKMCV